MGAFAVFRCDPSVANLGGGKDQDLALVGRVGQRLLVSSHGRTKDHFTGFGRCIAESPPSPNGSVFKDKQRWGRLGVHQKRIVERLAVVGFGCGSL